MSWAVPDMTEAYSYDLRMVGDIAVVALHGEKTREVGWAIWMRVKKAIEAQALTKVLILDEMEDRTTAMDIVDIQKRLAESGFPTGVRVAIMDVRRGESDNNNAFGETVAVNRGWEHIRVFENTERALAWLNRKDSA